MLDHSTNSLFIINLNSISPYSSLSMQIDLMTSLHALKQGTVLKMLTEIHIIKDIKYDWIYLHIRELIIKLITITKYESV